MNEELHIEETEPLAHVQFTRSSTRDGGLGYRIDVSAGCTNEEADTTFAIALRLKEKADDALRPKQLIDQLEESLRVIPANGAE